MLPSRLEICESVSDLENFSKCFLTFKKKFTRFRLQRKWWPQKLCQRKCALTIVMLPNYNPCKLILLRIYFYTAEDVCGCFDLQLQSSLKENCSISMRDLGLNTGKIYIYIYNFFFFVMHALRTKFEIMHSKRT